MCLSFVILKESKWTTEESGLPLRSDTSLRSA
jgi:hypothetical protein